MEKLTNFKIDPKRFNICKENVSVYDFSGVTIDFSFCF